VTIRLTVDELVLEGIRPEEATGIRLATEQRLERLLSGRGVEPRPVGNVSVDRRTETTAAADVGGAIAAAICDRLGGATSRGEN
jgi:hypothetical protein